MSSAGPLRAMRALVVRIGGLFAGNRRDRELAEEFESHLEMQIEDNLRAGMTPAEARRDALLKTGGISLATKGVLQSMRDGDTLHERLLEYLKR